MEYSIEGCKESMEWMDGWMDGGMDGWVLMRKSKSYTRNEDLTKDKQGQQEKLMNLLCKVGRGVRDFSCRDMRASDTI